LEKSRQEKNGGYKKGEEKGKQRQWKEKGIINKEGRLWSWWFHFIRSMY
jgi:hypothetical protein